MDLPRIAIDTDELEAVNAAVVRMVCTGVTDFVPKPANGLSFSSARAKSMEAWAG